MDNNVYDAVRDENDRLSTDFENYCNYKDIDCHTNTMIYNNHANSYNDRLNLYQDMNTMVLADNKRLSIQLQDTKKRLKEVEEIMYNMNMYHSVQVKRYANILRFIFSFNEFRKVYIQENIDLERIRYLLDHLMSDFYTFYLSDTSTL